LELDDNRHIENRQNYQSSRLFDFSKILRGEAVFLGISAMEEIPTFHRTYFFFRYNIKYQAMQSTTNLAPLALSIFVRCRYHFVRGFLLTERS